MPASYAMSWTVPAAPAPASRRPIEIASQYVALRVALVGCLHQPAAVAVEETEVAGRAVAMVEPHHCRRHASPTLARDSDMGSSPLEAAMALALTLRSSSGEACVAEQRDAVVQARRSVAAAAVQASPGTFD